MTSNWKSPRRPIFYKAKSIQLVLRCNIHLQAQLEKCNFPLVFHSKTRYGAFPHELEKSTPSNFLQGELDTIGFTVRCTSSSPTGKVQSSIGFSQQSAHYLQRLHCPRLSPRVPAPIIYSTCAARALRPVSPRPSFTALALPAL